MHAHQHSRPEQVPVLQKSIIFLYLCISISLLRPYTLFSRSPLVNKLSLKIHHISKGIQTPSWYRSKPNSITEGEEKGIKSVASPCNDKVAGFVLSRNSYALIESYAHLDSCARPKKCRPCHAHLKLRGGRAQTSTHRPQDSI